MIRFVGLILIVGLIDTLSATEEPKAPNPDKAAIVKLLLRAADAYQQDQVEANTPERSLSYIWAKERISNHPLIYVATGLVANDADQEALTVAKQIKDVGLQAYCLIQIADDQVENKRLETADQTIKRVVQYVREQVQNAELQKALQPSLNTVLLKRYASVEEAKKQAQILGIDWQAEDATDQTFTVAQFLFELGKLAEARNLLLALPADTFAKRQGQRALARNDGAGFYAWIGRSVEAPDSYSADHVLLEWLSEDGDSKQLQEFLNLIKPQQTLRYQILCLLAAQYQEAKDDQQLQATLAQMKTFEDQLIEKLPAEERSKIEFAQQLARCDFGADPTIFFKDGKLLEKYRDLPVSVMLIPILCKKNLPELAEEIAKDKELNEQLHAQLAIAWYDVKQPQRAEPHLKQLKSPLARPRFTVVSSMVHYKQGEKKLAQETLLEGIKQVEAVRSTNNWFPPPEEVKHEDKWHAMTFAYRLAVQQESIDPLLSAPSQYVSVKIVAHELGLRNDQKSFEKLLAGLAERKDGSRTYALIGFSQGVAHYQKEQHKSDP